MKNKIFGLLFMLLVSHAASAQEPAQSPLARTGRYQMMEATFSAAPDASVKQTKRLVILDTVTGALTTCDYVYNDAGKSKEDGREYWGMNGACGPFGTAQGWYIPKASKK